ncbi:hypothetical protein TNCV_1900881 [Trichonephila clavipes]|nr:hypothetical protein TNCV_1900881 [Trichonephila clavipes]
MCPNCSSEPATPAHILEGLGLTKQDLADDPLLVLDFLKVYDVMDLISYEHFSAVAGSYNFAFRVTCVTFAYSKIDTSPRKRSKDSRSLLPKRKEKNVSTNRKNSNRNTEINRKKIITDIRRDLLGYDIEISTSTVWKRNIDIGGNAAEPRTKQFLTQLMKKRLPWVKNNPYGLLTTGRSDEAHFWLNGYDNKQNCCIWSEANPQVYVETPLDPEKLTVWCAIRAGGILLQKR